MGADERYDEAASQFSQEMLSGDNRREFIHQGEDGEWICPDSNDVMEKAGVLTIEEYIQRRRDTILPYAQSRNIYGRCKSSEQIGSNLLWWEINYFSNDAAEALTGQAANGVLLKLLSSSWHLQCL
jgi:hypothetical protein